MTATRIITDHDELDNVGSVSHASIDSHVLTAPFVIVSGTAGTVPAASRKLAAGTGISIVDGGAGGNITISATGGGGSSTQTMWMEIPSGSNDGVNADFTLSQTPSPLSALMLYVNGVLMMQGTGSDYTVESSNTVHLLVQYRSGSNILATYPYVVAGMTPSVSWMEIPSGSVDGLNTDFTLAHTPSPLSSLMFYVNGILQMQGSSSDYYISGSTTIKMTYACRSGSNLLATYPY